MNELITCLWPNKRGSWFRSWWYHSNSHAGSTLETSENSLEKNTTPSPTRAKQGKTLESDRRTKSIHSRNNRWMSNRSPIKSQGEGNELKGTYRGTRIGIGGPAFSHMTLSLDHELCWWSGPGSCQHFILYLFLSRWCVSHEGRFLVETANHPNPQIKANTVISKCWAITW